MNLGFGTKPPGSLDAALFVNDTELLRIAQAVSAAAEHARAVYRTTEEPIILGLLGGMGYWSDSVPWFEWLTDLSALQRCADGLALPMAELANALAYRIKPPNWQTFAWMAEALRSHVSELALAAEFSKIQAVRADDWQRAQAAARTGLAKAGARGKLANDPKQADKAIVKECWRKWQNEPSNYDGKEAFARDMREKFPNLDSTTVITRWCRAWDKEK